MEEINIKERVHKQICEELNEVYVAKNSDYGDSFSKVRNEFPYAVLIRLSDKLERLKSLYFKLERDVKVDESIDDTLLDLANYAILELVERKTEVTNFHP